MSIASLFGLVFLLSGGDMVWPGCLYLASRLKQNPAVLHDFVMQHFPGMCMEEKGCGGDG
jgi:hypothetical protein